MQLVDYSKEEGMLRHGTHCIVRDSRRHGTAHPRWVREEGIETSVAAIVEIDVDATVEGEHEVADCVCALDGEGVVVECVEEPGIF